MAPLYQKKPKDDGVFSLYVDVLHGNEDWETLLGLLPLIEKRKGLSESEFVDFATNVVSKALMSTARLQTFEQAQQLFNQLPGKLKKQDYAVSAYVELLQANGKGGEAESVLLKAMKKSSVGAYLPLFRQVKFDQVVELNKYLQTLLKKDESDRDLLTAVGYIAAGRGDWSLVTKVLSRTVGPDSKVEDLKVLANAYCELGDSQNAVKVYQKLQD
jgi:HemY protein